VEITLYQSRTELSPRSALADPLRARECDILNLIAKGVSNKEIARKLTITLETEKSHVKNIFTNSTAASEGRP
jgi:LuxR family transcriptional regulator, maltose regulon positive regulatory protein